MNAPLDWIQVVEGPTASLDLVPAGGCERDTHRRGFA
jgi:hypothetical protein